jgi:MbtH protein
MGFDDEDATFRVVVNDEEQYSIWFADREIPPGWRAAGPCGKKDECLGYIEQVWNDIRPRSVRDRLRAG